MIKRYILLGVIFMLAVVAGIFVWQKKDEKSQISVVRDISILNEPNHADVPVSESQKTEQNETVVPVTSESAAEDKLDFPADELDRMVAFFSEEANDHIDLAVFEADLRQSLANGCIPPWQNITPKLTREECIKMSTTKLAEVCFSSSILTRSLLIHNKPIYAFSRLRILYPCYAELFERDDLWEGALNAYPLYAANLNPTGDPNIIIDSLMGLDNLPYLFQLPKMREQLAGRELLFVREQLEALKAIRSYVNGDSNEATVSSTPFFSITTPISLTNFSLALMQKASASKSASAINTISKLGIPKKPTMGQVKNYMDICIIEIDQFLDSYQE